MLVLLTTRELSVHKARWGTADPNPVAHTKHHSNSERLSRPDMLCHLGSLQEGSGSQKTGM